MKSKPCTVQAYLQRTGTEYGTGAGTEDGYKRARGRQSPRRERNQ